MPKELAEQGTDADARDFALATPSPSADAVTDSRPRLADNVECRQVPKGGFSARLPTCLPGISFTACGRAWFQQDLSAHSALPLRTAKAATLAGVHEIAKTETERFEPQAAFHAQHLRFRPCPSQGLPHRCWSRCNQLCPKGERTQKPMRPDW
jgi:hypothetical protein